eukprot:PhM_4_TR5782/c0_g1_i1/m.57067
MFHDLADSIQYAGVECHNQDTRNNVASIFSQLADSMPPGQYLQSDADEQLLLRVPFKNGVKLAEIDITAPAGDMRRPKHIKVYLNPTSMSFDTVARLDPAMEVDLGEWTDAGDGQSSVCSVRTPFAKFQNVTCLALFVESNEEEGDVTVVSGLKFKGQPVGGFDVSNIKSIG